MTGHRTLLSIAPRTHCTQGIASGTLRPGHCARDIAPSSALHPGHIAPRALRPGYCAQGIASGTFAMITHSDQRGGREGAFQDLVQQGPIASCITSM